jgi:type 1 glutamine amidotransferase
MYMDMNNMASSRKDSKSKNVDNVISSEQTPIKIFRTILSNDDMENKNVSTYQCMSGINISINHCISKLNNQDIEITGLSKLNPVRIKKLPVRSRYALFYNVCTQEHVTDVTTTGCHLRHPCFREPSRIQVKWLTRKFGKSRLLRKRLGHKIKRSVPKSSHLHYIVENIMHCEDIRMKCIPDVYCPKKVDKKCRKNRSA